MSMKKMAASGDLKKVDKYRAPLGLVNEHPNNIRGESKENREHVLSIYNTLRVQFEKDLEVSNEEGPRFGSKQLRKGARLMSHDTEVVVDENDRIWATDGNSTLRALRMAVANGLIDDRFLVDVVPVNIESADRVKYKMIMHGRAKNPSPLEFGIAMRELRDGVNGCPPWSIDKLVEQCDRTRVSVLELLRLADADVRIHALINEGTISSHFALAQIKEFGDEAYEYILMAQDDAKGAGKQRVTAAVTNGKSLPKKLVATAIQSVQIFSERLPQSTRVELARLEGLAPEQIQGKTVPVDVAVLIELLKAGGQIEEERRKQAEKAHAAQQAATQAVLAA
jgi:hypothetical protein